jgi:hypothetical protein
MLSFAIALVRVATQSLGLLVALRVKNKLTDWSKSQHCQEYHS